MSFKDELSLLLFFGIAHAAPVSGQTACEINLTSAASSDRNPAWSPDGRHIVFDSDRDGNWNLFVVSLDGGGLRRLTDHPASDRRGRWAPDGTRLVFDSDRGGSPGLYIRDVNGTASRVVVDGPGEDSFPDWSPDGTRVAFSSSRSGNLDIHVVKHHQGIVDHF